MLAKILPLSNFHVSWCWDPYGGPPGPLPGRPSDFLGVDNDSFIFPLEEGNCLWHSVMTGHSKHRHAIKEILKDIQRNLIVSKFIYVIFLNRWFSDRYCTFTKWQIKHPHVFCWFMRTSKTTLMRKCRSVNGSKSCQNNSIRLILTERAWNQKYTTPSETDKSYILCNNCLYSNPFSILQSRHGVLITPLPSIRLKLYLHLPFCVFFILPFLGSFCVCLYRSSCMVFTSCLSSLSTLHVSSSSWSFSHSLASIYTINAHRHRLESRKNLRYIYTKGSMPFFVLHFTECLPLSFQLLLYPKPTSRNKGWKIGVDWGPPWQFCFN